MWIGNFRLHLSRGHGCFQLWVGNVQFILWGMKYPWYVRRDNHTFGPAWHVGPVSAYRHNHGPFFVQYNRLSESESKEMNP